MPALTNPLDADTAAVTARRLFSRVLVGVDPSAESREAVRQAARLMDGRGRLELLAAYEVVYPGGVTGMVTNGYADELHRLYAGRAAVALDDARVGISREDAEGKVIEGRPADALLAEAARRRTTLLCVGSHDGGRAAGILLGSVATDVIHSAPCSVLVARAGLAPTLRTIVVGLDGSPESTSAYFVAAELAERFGADLWPIAAHGGQPVDLESIDMLTRHRQEVTDAPVEALVGASANADLLVVGSRGLRGLKALASVSERVAHQATCSTLIVREPEQPTEKR